MHNSLAKKLFAVGSAAAMALSLVAPLAATAAPHGAGTNVSDSTGTIWFITSSGTRRAYTSAGAFLSYGFNSWSQVMPANAEDLALPVDSMGFIPPQDGTVFCATETKGSDVNGECSLITGGMKAAFTSASVFTGLGFSFSRAQYGDSSFLSKSSNIDNTTSAHRTGVLVNNNGTVQLVGATGLLGIPSIDVFNSWGYSFANVVPANAADKAMTQTGVMASRVPGQLNPSWTTQPGSPVPPPVGTVSVSLAPDNPAGGSIVASSSAVTLAKFTFTGSGTVTQVELKRIGVSADTVLSNVYLYDGGMRLTDAASVGGNSMITFNTPSGLFTVSGSKTISVVAEIAGSATSGQTVGVQLTGFALAGYSLGAVSISGNLHTVTTVSDLATVDFGTVTPTGSAFDPAAGVEVFRSTVTIGTREVKLSRLAVRQIGSVSYNDIKNLKLLIDGNQVASVAGLDSNGYAMFTFAQQTLQSGNREFVVLADLVGGSSRTFQFQIRNKVDVDFTDSNYGVVISPVDTFPVGSAAANDINSGTLTVQKTSDSPTGDVIEDATNAALAKYTVTAYGESMKIETLDIGVTSSDAAVGSIRNGRVLINGSQYGSTATLSKCTNSACTTGGTSYTLNYTVMPGSPVTLEIRGDIFDNDGTDSLNAGDTLTAYVMDGSSNVQRMTSLGYASLPSAAVSGNSLTVSAGSMTLTKDNNYANQTTPLPQANYKVGDFNLSAGSAEDIRINTIALSITQASTTAVLDLNDLTMKVAGNTYGTIKSTYSSGTTTFSGSYTLPKNQNVTVELFATVSASTTAVSGTSGVTANLNVSGTTVSSGSSATAVATGQTITYGTGTFTMALDGSSPDAALIADNQTKTVAAFKLTTANDTFTVTDVAVSLASTTSVQNIILKDGSTVLATLPAASNATFTGLSLLVPQGSSGKVLTVDLQLGAIGVGAGTGNDNVTLTLNNIKHVNSNGTTAYATGAITGNGQYAYAAVPTITPVALPSTTLTAGTKSLAKITISSGGTGEIAWNKIIFNIAKTSTVNFHTPSLVNADTGIAITGTIATSVNFSAPNITSGTLTFTVDSNGGEERITSRTYELKATVTGTIVDGDYIITSIAAGQTGRQASATSTGIAQTETFAWSDEYLASHSTTTADWYGDYLVRLIPTDAQTLTK